MAALRPLAKRPFRARGLRRNVSIVLRISLTLDTCFNFLVKIARGIVRSRSGDIWLVIRNTLEKSVNEVGRFRIWKDFCFFFFEGREEDILRRTSVLCSNVILGN